MKAFFALRPILVENGSPADVKTFFLALLFSVEIFRE